MGPARFRCATLLYLSKTKQTHIFEVRDSHCFYLLFLLDIRCCIIKDSGYTNILDILIYFRIRHSFARLRPVILSADWSISRLQSWTCSSLSTVAEFVKLTQSFVIEIQRQSADLYKVQLCNRQFFVVSTPIYVVKIYECHPLGIIDNDNQARMVQC